MKLTSSQTGKDVGAVVGKLITKPLVLDWASSMTVTAMIKDGNKRTWRILAHAELATKLLSYEIGQKLKLIGVKCELRPNAWDNAKRQIVPHSIECAVITHQRQVHEFHDGIHF